MNALLREVATPGFHPELTGYQQAICFLLAALSDMKMVAYRSGAIREVVVSTSALNAD